MKLIVSIIGCLLVSQMFAQQQFPSFLAGTWKIENSHYFEKWDVYGSNSLKGLSYSLENGNIEVMEFLSIKENKGKIIYSASVRKQNDGKTIDFNLIQSDSMFVFENKKHDFPNRICYKKINDELLEVSLTGKENLISFMLIKQKEVGENSTENSAFDATLAKELNADEYGMKPYFLVILKTGENPQTDDKEKIQKLFAGHMSNMDELVKQNILVVAGPMGKNENKYRGIFILHNLESVEKVKEILATDPAISNGILDADIYDWYGSAALPTYLPYSEKITKLKP